jgi:hypothetical protein
MEWDDGGVNRKRRIDENRVRKKWKIKPFERVKELGKDYNRAEYKRELQNILRKGVDIDADFS